MKTFKCCVIFIISTLCLVSFVLPIWAIDLPKKPVTKKEAIQIPLQRIVETFNVEVSDKSMWYLEKDWLTAHLVKLNSSANISDKQVDFFIDDKFVGSDKTTVGGYANFSILPHQSRQLNLQVGQHQIRAQVMDDVNSRIVKGYGTLTVLKANATLSKPTLLSPKEYYTFGETIVLTGSLHHSRYTEFQKGSSGGGSSSGGRPIIVPVIPGKPGFPSGSSSSSSSSSPPSPLSPPSPPLPITNAEVRCVGKGHIATVRTNNHGKFECLITLTENMLDYYISGRCEHFGIYTAQFNFSFPGNNNYKSDISEKFTVKLCPPGMKYIDVEYTNGCCNPK